jgi:hypothetical protein
VKESLGRNVRDEGIGLQRARQRTLSSTVRYTKWKLQTVHSMVTLLATLCGLDAESSLLVRQRLPLDQGRLFALGLVVGDETPARPPATPARRFLADCDSLYGAPPNHLIRLTDPFVTLITLTFCSQKGFSKYSDLAGRSISGVGSVGSRVTQPVPTMW